MQWLQFIHHTPAKAAAASFRVGDDVRVWYRILEQGKERFAQFEGIVIRYRGQGPSKTFTVRRVTYGEGVERVFPVDAKVISRIEVLRKGKVKRSRLYFLRDVIGKTRIAAAQRSSGAISMEGIVPVIIKPTDVDAAPEKSEGAVAAARKPADTPASSA
ncbi:MAG: 50S ribosomal protein L19 [Candidatus Omnitrophica bacterium]|nr:50S ribosomal protein L19 [Candidatus Omnitrophota bacterium]